MRTVILLAAVLMYGSAPVYAHKGMQRIASAVKSKAGKFVATGAIASALLFTVPTGVEAGQFSESAEQSRIETNLELADEMQQLTNDILARHSQLVPTQSLFPTPGLLDHLPASVRKLEVSKIKRDLRSLMTQIYAIEHRFERMEDLGLQMARLFDDGAGIERWEWHVEKILKAKPRNTDQLLQHLEQQIDTVESYSELASSEADVYYKLKLAQQLGVLQARTALTLDAIKKLERNKAKQRRRLWRFGRR